jgi:acyl-coenzyme A synthetase/AMP-(fatty) acid ligase
MIANMLGVETLPIKPGSVGKAVCGYDIKIFNEEGNEVQANQQGYVVVKPHYLQERCLIYGKTIPALERAI